LLNLQFQLLIFFNQFLVFDWFHWFKWNLVSFVKIRLFMHCWRGLLFEEIITFLQLVILYFFIWIRIQIYIKVFIFHFCYIPKVWTGVIRSLMLFITTDVVSIIRSHIILTILHIESSYWGLMLLIGLLIC
jgi:hypothetical protein